MTLAITFKVLATGSQNVSGMIYDYSGSILPLQRRR